MVWVGVFQVCAFVLFYDFDDSSVELGISQKRKMLLHLPFLQQAPLTPHQAKC